MDRYIAGGEVAEADLRHVWQDTTQFSGVWDWPIYGDFFRVVREVNASLPPVRRLRVLLGIRRSIGISCAASRRGQRAIVRAWSASTASGSRRRRNPPSTGTLMPPTWSWRDVIARHRRALLVFGDGHLRRGLRGVVTRLEERRRSRSSPSRTLSARRTRHSRPSSRHRIVADAASAASRLRRGDAMTAASMPFSILVHQRR